MSVPASDRRSGIGASESAPIVLGRDKFGRTAVDVYAAKVLDTRETSSPNQALARGKILEPAVIAWYELETGSAVTHAGAHQRTVRSEAYPWLFATPDGLLPDRVIEAKTARSHEGWGEPGTNEIPLEYLIQAHHQMLCTGLRETDLPVLFGGLDFQLYHVEFETELAALIVSETGLFWHDHVLAKVPPAPRTGADVETIYRRDNGAIQVADAELIALCQCLSVVRLKMSSFESSEEVLLNKIKVAMGEAAYLVDAAGTPLVSWKSNKPSKKFDSAQFRADHPALFATYQREQAGARVFRLSVKTEGEADEQPARITPARIAATV